MAQEMNLSEDAVGSGSSSESRVEPDLSRGSTISLQKSPDFWPSAVEDVLEQSIQRIVDAGFPDARISMVITEGDRPWLVPKIGSGTWSLHSRSRHRRLEPDTVLASVVREKRARLIGEVAVGETQELADEPEVGADRYAIPLLDDAQDTIAIAEIRCVSYARHDSGEKLPRIEQLGTAIALALTRAIRIEELRVARNLDDALVACLSWTNVDSAAHHFALRTSRILEAYSLFVRLIDRRRSALRLISGHGDFFDVALGKDLEIPLDDETPTAEAARVRKPVVINDVSEHEGFCSLRRKHAGTELGQALNRIASFACFPILKGKKVHGVVSVYSCQPCYFNGSRTRSLADMGSRLAILLAHLRKKEAEQRQIAELNFLRDVKPPLEGKLNLYSALRQQGEKIRQALDADVVSCFLLDQTRNRFVLRAQAGWADDRWVDAAWYAPNEGIVGYAAAHLEPRYVPDVLALRGSLRMLRGKYDRMMFGRELTDRVSCELIYLPLYFMGQFLGVVAIYRLQDSSFDGQKTGFRTTSPRVLQEAASTLSAFVTALQEHDFDRWSRQELVKRQAVMQALLTSEKLNLKSLLKGFVQAVSEHYHFHYTAAYLCQKGGTFSLQGQVIRGEPFAVPELLTAETTDNILLAIATGRPQAVRVAPTEAQCDPNRVKWENTVREIFMVLLHLPWTELGV